MSKEAGINRIHPNPARIPNIRDLVRVVRLSRKAGVLVEGYPVSLNKRDFTSAMMQLEVKKLAELIAMRSKWSIFLMISVGGIMVIQMMLFVAVGRNWISFSDQWLARMLFPGMFGEVVGLVYIIINFLFPNQEKTGKISP